MSLSVLIQHLYDSPIAAAVRESDNLFPALQTFHIWLVRLIRGEGASGATRAVAFTSLLLWTGVVVAWPLARPHLTSGDPRDGP